MAIASGTRLGPYEITGSLGAGGMGEVYKARDTRLDRTVAIKVLPSLLASDPALRARFEREARSISALNHPHICTLHDVGQEGSIAFLVMEYVDGLPPSGPMPPEMAIPIAIQICDALGAAHRAGIVHRDLKPSNILLTGRPGRSARTGTPHVKLLDFGLATRAAQPQSGAAIEATVTGALTGAHAVIGTPQYMAPEQIEGREADARTDIFALGCVIYELLTGKRAFEGKTASGVMAAILATEPRPMRELQPVTPPALEWIVGRCLAKDPEDRWQTVRDLRAALERVLHEPVSTSAAAPLQRTHPRLPWIVAASLLALALVAALAAVRLYFDRPAPDARVFTSLFIPPTNAVNPPALRLALSPDGRKLAYTATDASGRVVIWVRWLDRLDAQPIPGTMNAAAPFWSPDSRFIGFYADGTLKKVDVAGGPVVTITRASAGPAASWGANDVIAFTDNTNIARVSASGGVATKITSVRQEEGERLHISPFFLPDGRHFLYAVGLAGSVVKSIRIASITGDTDVVLLPDATSNAMYASGRLVFLRDTTLMAQPFDVNTLKLTGEPQPIAEQIQINPSTGTGAFSVSQSGVLVYQTGSTAAGTALTWLDRSGKKLGIVGERTGYLDLRLSPDGTRVAATVVAENSRTSDVWVIDLIRRVRTRFTFGAVGAGAIWSPDGDRLAYVVRREGSSSIVQKASNGIGQEQVVFEDRRDKFPLSWSPDGRFLLVNEVLGALRGSLLVLPVAPGSKPYKYPNSGFSEIPAEFSPDGKWIAYVSNEGGRKEVYVTTFPELSGRWQVSQTGGDYPRWRRDGKELFFLTADRMMSAEVNATGPQFAVGVVKPLFDTRWVPARSVYDVTADGSRFLMVTWDPSPTDAGFNIVVNWPAALR
jgi:serine/threonine protein kinase/dipeptidyl aminopeptidase/acylaminoacyl peptidase